VAGSGVTRISGDLTKRGKLGGPTSDRHGPRTDYRVGLKATSCGFESHRGHSDVHLSTCGNGSMSRGAGRDAQRSALLGRYGITVQLQGGHRGPPGVHRLRIAVDTVGLTFVGRVTFGPLDLRLSQGLGPGGTPRDPPIASHGTDSSDAGRFLSCRARSTSAAPTCPSSTA
jgi:hypothetical protein